MTESAADRDELIQQIESAVTELGPAEDNEAIPLPELTEQLAALHSGLQGALTELDRA